MINCKLEGLNRVLWDVCVMALAEPYLESRKLMGVVETLFFFHLSTNSIVISKGG